MTTCENCGIPDDALTVPGRTFRLTMKPQNGYQRERRLTVWCCTDECAIQSLARAKYGESSHRCPVTLAQFRQMEGQPFLRASDRHETPSQPIDSTTVKTAYFENAGDSPSASFVTRQQRTGRPRLHASGADRARAYRRRQGHREVV